MKREIRILGISGGARRLPPTIRDVVVVGAVLRGGYWLEGVMRTTIERNGWNAASQLARMIRSSVHFRQTRLIITDGLALAGLNIVNIKTLHEKTGIPVIAVSMGRREMEALNEKIRQLDRHASRRSALKAAGQLISLPLESARKRIHVYCAGVNLADVKGIMRQVCMTETPEPIRVARVFSSAFNRYRSKRFPKD